MKKQIKSIALVLAIVLLCSTTAYAAVPETAEPRASDTLMRYTAYVYKAGTLSLQVWFDVTGTTCLDLIGVKFITVERSPDGTTWTAMKTFYSSDYPDLLAENEYAYASHVNYVGTRGYYYRAYVAIYGKLGSSSSIRYLYTDPVQL